MFASQADLISKAEFDELRSKLLEMTARGSGSDLALDANIEGLSCACMAALLHLYNVSHYVSSVMAHYVY